MIPTTLDGESRAACLWMPDGRSMTLRATVDTDKTMGLTGRETRRAMSSTLRLGLEYSVTITAAEYALQRETSHTSTGELPVQVPLWPAAFDAANPGTLSTRWWVTGTQTEIGTLGGTSWASSAPTPTGAQISVPTMRGHLTRPVEWQRLDPRWVRGAVRFEEAGPASEAVVIPSETWDEGPDVAGATTCIFPLDLLDHMQADPNENSVVVEFSQRLGFGRSLARHVYPQLAVRNPEHTLTLNGAAQLSTLLRWFADHSGSVTPFWMPVWTEEMSLAADTSSGSVEVTLTSATPLGSYRRIAFLLADGSIVTRTVESIDGDVLTLDLSPGTLSAATTAIITLALVRFAADTLTIRGDRQPVFTTTVALVEIREEVTTPAGENAGVTIGVQDPVAYLYEFRAGDEVWRFTSHDAILDATPMSIETEATDETVGGTLLSPAGRTDGEITVTVTGGVAPFTVSVTGQTDQVGSGPVFTFSGLSGGDYDITVTDDAGATEEDFIHVFVEAHEAGTLRFSSSLTLRPVDTTQSNAVTGLAKFDSSLGTLLGVTFGYSDGGSNNTALFFDPDIMTTNTATSSRTIRTEYSQVARLVYSSTTLYTFNHSKNSTNTITAGFFALPNNTENLAIPVSGVSEITDSGTLTAVTGSGNVTGLSIDSDAPTVNLVVTAGSSTPLPTYAYTANRPQITSSGIVALYRYQIARA